MNKTTAALYRKKLLRMNKLILVVACSLVLFSGCNIFNPKEQVPTYIHLEPFIFQNADSNITGSGSHIIPSAWVYADDQPVGVFDLPCTIPVLISKTSKITLFPAVTSQGLKNYLIQYPFYRSDTTTLVYNPGNVQNYTPVTSYVAGMTIENFPIKVNFEEGLSFTATSGDASMVVERNTANVFEGTGIGAVYLTPTQRSSESVSKNSFSLPSGNCYLELNYKCSVPFQVGLRGVDADGNQYEEYVGGFNPKTTWNKIYIEIGAWAKTNYVYSKFYIKIRTTLDDEPAKYTEGYLFLDNIKVISR